MNCAAGSCYVAADTRSFARDIGLEPRTTPIESPQSNGMAEAFVRTIKRDYVRVSPCPNAETVMFQLPSWITHYNEVHPHKALGYSIVAHETKCTKPQLAGSDPLWSASWNNASGILSFPTGRLSGFVVTAGTWRCRIRPRN